jgi:hypothetical protein
MAMTTTSERPKRTTFAAALALVALCLLAPAAASAQWTTPDPTNGSTNYPNGNVGVGTTGPNYKVEISGSTSRNTLGLTSDGDTVGYAGIRIQPKTWTGIPSNRTAAFILSMRKDGWYDGGDTTGPSFIIESTSPAGGYAAPFMITPTNNVILNGGTGASGLSYGWVGVGTVSPVANLHVNNSSSFAAIRVSGSGGGLMHFFDSAAPTGQQLYQWRSEGGVFRMSLANDTANAFIQQNILVANSSGNVGLGTASPNERLHVNGGMVVTGAASEQTGVNGLFLGFSGTAANIDAVQQGTDFRALSMSAKSLSFNTWNGSALVLGLYQSSTGNVGVGTASPLFKLDVAGQVRSSSGGFVFPDGSTQTTASVGTVTGVTAGTGLTGGGTTGSLTLTNSDPGSSQFIFKNVANAAGATQFSAGSNNDAILFEGTGGTTVSFNATAKKVTINSSSSASSGWTDGGSIVRLTSSTANVGIGTDSPTVPLDVQTPVTAATANGVRLQQTLSAGANNGTLNGLYINPTFNDGMAVGNAHNALVTVGGNVGIGTASTGAGLDVQNAGVPVGGASYGARFQQAIPSSGNNSNSTAVLINPTFNDGAAVGVSHNGLVVASGNVGIGNLNPTHTLEVNGTINASDVITGKAINATYQDVAEWVPSSQKLSAGTVVVLDKSRTNHVLASSKAYDTGVAGVVSDSPGVILGQGGGDKLKVATTGRVKVKVDATRAPIGVGDLLVTSDVEGVAMKSVPVDLGGTQIHRPGTIIGKALEPLDKGTGEILVLLSLQ